MTERGWLLLLLLAHSKIHSYLQCQLCFYGAKIGTVLRNTCVCIRHA